MVVSVPMGRIRGQRPLGVGQTTVPRHPSSLPFPLPCTAAITRATNHLHLPIPFYPPPLPHWHALPPFLAPLLSTLPTPLTQAVDVAGPRQLPLQDDLRGHKERLRMWGEGGLVGKAQGLGLPTRAGTAGGGTNKVGLAGTPSGRGGKQSLGGWKRGQG